MLSILNQPAEFVVIGGAAVGSLLVSTPAKVLKMTVARVARLLFACDGDVLEVRTSLAPARNPGL